jgi:amino acid transporter
LLCAARCRWRAGRRDAALGGIFAYLLEAYGPLPAFPFGWTELRDPRCGVGAIATIFAEYLGYFWPLSSQQVRYVAALAIVLIGAINYLGVQRAAVLQSITTALKYGALLALGLLAFTASGGSGAHFTPAWGGGISLSLLATALIPVLWTYDGWADPATMAGEISDPQRNLPRALIAGALCVMLVYLVVNVGFLYALAPAQMAGSRLIAASVAERIPLLGNAGAGVIAAAVVVAAFSGLNASMMTGSRVFFAMADRGLFFQAAARVSPRFQSPSVAIWLATALGVVCWPMTSRSSPTSSSSESGPSTRSWSPRCWCCAGRDRSCRVPTASGVIRWCRSCSCWPPCSWC